MELPRPPQALAALATFVRDRLAEVSDTLAPLLARLEGEAHTDTTRGQGEDHSVLAAARQFAMVIVGAAAPFATTSYSRARLVRQMHASGLLSDEHLIGTQRLLALGEAPPEDASGAPR